MWLLYCFLTRSAGLFATYKSSLIRITEGYLSAYHFITVSERHTNVGSLEFQKRQETGYKSNN